jgi:hypothetical protein
VYSGDNNYFLDYCRYVKKNNLTWLDLRGVKISHLMCSGFNVEEGDKITRFGTSLNSLHIRVSYENVYSTNSIDAIQSSIVEIIKSCTRLTLLILRRLRLLMIPYQ